MNIRHPQFVALLLLASLVFGIPVFAETPPPSAESSTPAAGVSSPPAEETAPAAEMTAAPAENEGPIFTEKGADTCLKCHDEEADAELPVFPIFKTKHAIRSDPRSPFAGLQCEACHGPGVKAIAVMEKLLVSGHVKKIRPGEKRPPILNFGLKTPTPIEVQNGMCLQCHQGKDRIGWQGSAHEARNFACASCHNIHAAQDLVLSKATQPQVCFKCHKKQQADFMKPSSHPVRSGKIVCSECHKPHGSNTTAVLAKLTVNQTCYTCHADKRGPLLWEHAPVTEDCTLCHAPHGSVYPALLRKSSPLLCQQCHSAAGHPAVARTGAALPGGISGPSGFLLAGGCTNCHSQVHGSNHPSGVKLMR